MCSCVNICLFGGKNPWSQKRASDPLEVVMSCTMWVVEQDVLFTVRPSLPPPYPHFLLQSGKAIGHMDWHYWVISEDCYLQQLSCLLASSTLVAFGVNGPAHQMTTLALTHQWPSCPCLFVQVHVLLQHQSQSQGWADLALSPQAPASALPIWSKKQSLAG